MERSMVRGCRTEQTHWFFRGEVAYSVVNPLKVACQRTFGIVGFPLAVDLRWGVTGQIGFPGGSAVKNLPAVQETWVQSLGQENPRGGHGNPLWYSCLENPMDRGAWQATFHRVTQSWTRLKRLNSSNSSRSESTSMGAGGVRRVCYGLLVRDGRIGSAF